jgi:hypothetical protein
VVCNGRLGALVAVLLAGVPIASCSTRAPDRPISAISEVPTPAGASELDRRFNLANARWYSAGEYYQLHDGIAQFSGDPGLEHSPLGDYTVRLNGAPVYLDADRDGDLDAAATLEWQAGGGGNGWSEDVYLWLWNGRRAEQILLPVFSADRCGDRLERIRVDAEGLRIDALLDTPESSCADSGVTPASWVVSMFHGYPVRLHPRLSAAAWCNPVNMTNGLAAGSRPVAHVAPDSRSPKLPWPAAYQKVQIGFDEEIDPHGITWHLALLEHADKTTDCGWIASL